MNKGTLASISHPCEELHRKYCLFDASVLVPYFIPKAHKNPKVHERAHALIESVRSGNRNHFFYIPNFCIAEVFSTFAKYAFGDWNKQVNQRLISPKKYNELREKFQKDIHNATLFYHYELTRYHVLSISLVAPIDHYFKLARGKTKVTPAGTFDQLILSMGIHLTRIHGAGNVVVVTADHRLAKLINKCRSNISSTARKTMKLNDAEDLVGVKFCPENFPIVANLNTPTDKNLHAIFGE